MKAEKIYKVIDVNDELPEVGRYGIILEGSDCIDSANYTQYKTWDNLGENTPTHWLKEEPEPQYCFSADELKEFAKKVWNDCDDNWVKNKGIKLKQYLSSLNIKP